MAQRAPGGQSSGDPHGDQRAGGLLLLGAQKSSLDFRSFTIATFALCGFANLSSIGMQIGGIGALAPNRRNDLARLGIASDAGRHHGQS
jgi:hypothetical protein